MISRENFGTFILKLCGTVINIAGMFWFAYFFNKAFYTAAKILYSFNNTINMDEIESVVRLRVNIIVFIFAFILIFELFNHIFYLIKKKIALIVMCVIELIAGIVVIYLAMSKNMPNYETFILLLPAINAFINFLILTVEKKREV